MRKFISIFFIILSLILVSGCSNQDKQIYNSAKKLVLTELNDPDSYKMEYYEVVGSDCVKIKFRAKNEFNAMKIYYGYCFMERYKDKSKDKLIVMGIYDKESDIEERVMKEFAQENKLEIKRYTE